MPPTTNPNSYPKTDDNHNNCHAMVAMVSPPIGIPTPNPNQNPNPTRMKCRCGEVNWGNIILGRDTAVAGVEDAGPHRAERADHLPCPGAMRRYLLQHDLHDLLPAAGRSVRSLCLRIRGSEALPQRLAGRQLRGGHLQNGLRPRPRQVRSSRGMRVSSSIYCLPTCFSIFFPSLFYPYTFCNYDPPGHPI